MKELRGGAEVRGLEGIDGHGYGGNTEHRGFCGGRNRPRVDDVHADISPEVDARDHHLRRRLHQFGKGDLDTVCRGPVQGVSKETAIALDGIDTQRVEPGDGMPHRTLLGFRSNHGNVMFGNEGQIKCFNAFGVDAVIIGQ